MTPSDAPESPAVTVVVPVYDEEGAVELLALEIRDVLQSIPVSFEILFIDDASRDGTVATLARVQGDLPELRVLRHRSNLGQSAAVATGFAQARGDSIVTLDGDGQNDPADIPKLLEELTRAHVVCGLRTTRRDTAVRRLSSRLANGFRKLVTGDPMRDAGCGLRAIRRQALKELPVFNGMHRFLPTLLHMQGLTIAQVPVGHRPRLAGRSKYGIGNRLFRGLVDCAAMLWWRRRVLPAERLLSEESPDGTSHEEQGAA